MDFAVTPEQAELRETVRRLLADVSPSAQVRRVMATDTGYDPHTWRRLGDLGLTAIAIPTAYGGAGGSMAELAIVLTEMGRAVFPGPYLAGVVAAALLLHTKDDAQHTLLPDIAAGRTIATTTLGGPSATVRTNPLRAKPLRAKPLRAGKNPDGSYRLTGTAPYVLDGHIADVVLAVADTDAGPTLLHLRTRTPGVAVTPLPTMDQTRRLSRLEFTEAIASVLGVEGGAAPAVTPALDVAAVAVAAEAVGGATRCLEMAVEYAKVRVQFDRPIGAFQAIKHRCADLLVEVESARSAAQHAAALAEPGVYASLAKAYCATVYTRVAQENIQLHGGIGFTWEHDAHLHLKRAKSSEVLFGTPAEHRARIGAAVGITAG